ncbi:MAG: hypothetical protein JWP30_1254 [Homoserinimonas sp.]|nr:hypothetical protein [Homoserinimonas sp.]
MSATIQASSRGPLLQVVKTSVAATAAWLLSTLLLGQPLPIFAAIAALLVVQPSVNQSLAKGIERSLGVILGVVLAYGAGLVFGASSWIVLAIIAVSLFLAWALRLTPGSANQIPISAMLVLALGGVDSPDYALLRIVETLIGVGVGLLVNAAIVPPVLLAPAHQAVVRLTNNVAATLESLAEALRTGPDRSALASLLTEARTLRPLQHTAQEALTRAEESLMLNPRGGRHRTVLQLDRDLMSRLNVLVTRVLGMARAVRDRYDPDLANEPIVKSIALELSRAAHDLRLLALSQPPPESREQNFDDLPALTAPLRIATPHPEHWILIGSLMEDIRRVREEITGTSDS